MAEQPKAAEVIRFIEHDDNLGLPDARLPQPAQHFGAPSTKATLVAHSANPAYNTPVWFRKATMPNVMA